MTTVRRSGSVPPIAGHPGPRPGDGHVPMTPAEVEQSIASRFREQVLRAPDALAISDVAEGELTYGQLDALANRVAHAILAGGVPAAPPIALLLDTGIAQVTGLLGALKAGHAYVPIDPAAPVARIAAILEDTSPPLVLANNATASLARAAAGETVTVLNLDALDAGLPSSDPAVERAPEAEAYALYTSGSTGRPKGVVQTQRNVLHNVMRHTNSFLIGAGDRQSLLYTYAVYGGTRDIFNALLNGASLHVYSVARHGVADLAPWMRKTRISLYCSVATVFRHLLQTLGPQTVFPDLRLIKLGGEATYLRDIEQLRPLLAGGCVAHCGLGATETGLARTFWVGHDTQVTKHTVPLGYPVEGMDIQLLDEAGDPVAPGEIGEIVIESGYLSLGYRGNEAQTREVFSPSPTRPGFLRYRTGDLGVLGPDGCLEHRGRKDFQVKIRGNRVEIAEVEQSLLALPEIREAVILPKPDPRGEMRLVAYVVATPAQTCTLATVRRALAAKLPQYMLPEALVALPAFPLLPNGKINRQALPEPDFQVDRTQQPYAPPRTPFEHELARIWARRLDVERVGIDDNFFELGGHSLLATRALAEFGDDLEVELPVALLFAHPTIRELALAIVQTLSDGEEPA